ncbi:S-layer homology domain-containing protein [Paenibacillus xylanexedens]|uniref:S-layer homology domain-containing protein n=1 Tax=Paenibacillus xylanexedens TaxID=528191 RepID=UPI0011A786B3|nr:S-layer homology domain-containing protein [Paenibacillus xylanexedens]
MKKLIISITAAATILGATPALAATSFSDVSSTNWAAPAIDFLVSQKAVSGYADGTFKPNRLVSKAEAAHIYRVLFPDVGSNKVALKYTDVKSHWALKDMTYLFGEDQMVFEDKMAVINDKYYSFLNPDKKLTRGELALIIGFLTPEIKTSDADVHTILGVLQSYPDLKLIPEDLPIYPGALTPEILVDDLYGTDPYFITDYDDIKAKTFYNLITSGIMAGSNGKFRPDAQVTRAEAAATFQRLYEYLNQ